MRRRALLAAALLVLAVGAVYRAALDNGFHFDDEPSILQNDRVRISAPTPQALWGAATHGVVPRRPLPYASFALDWWRGGGAPRAFQQTNLALHLLATLAVFALLLEVLRPAAPPGVTPSPPSPLGGEGWGGARPGTGPDPSPPSPLSGEGWGGATAGAFLGAAVWALHPIQVQAVVYIVQRMAEMAALGVIAGVWAYLRGRRTGRWRWYGLSVLALAFGGLSKENAWIGPVLVVLAEYGVVRRGAVLATWRDRLVWSLPVAGLVWVVGDLALGGPLAGWLLPGYAYRSFTLVERLLTEPRVIGLHLGQWLWPWPERFSIEHEVEVSRGVLEPPTTLVGLLGVVVWVGGGLWLLWCGGRRRRVGFGLLWFAAALVVESTVVPLELVFEHRMYLPTVGLGVVTGVGVSWAWRRLRPAAVALPGALVLAALAASTSARLPVWRDNLTLYAEAVRHAPGSARAWVNYGLGLAQAGRHDEAMAAYRRALALEDLPEARHNLAMQLERRGRLREALAELDRAVARVPRLAPARLERGRIRHRLGDLRGAVEDYDAALALRPGWWVPLDNRALARLALGDVAGALADLDRAIGLAPAVARLWADRGAVRLVAGDPAAALADLERAVALGADDAGVHYNRGRALARLGRAEEAAAAWRRACALGLARACRAAGSRAREGTPAPFPGFGNGIPGREQESAGMTD